MLTPKSILSFSLLASIIFFNSCKTDDSIKKSSEECSCTLSNDAPVAESQKYSDVAQAFYQFYKDTGKYPPGAYTMVEEPGVGYWDFRKKRGVPGNDKTTIRKTVKFPDDLPATINKNIHFGSQVPSWAPCPRTLSENGMNYVMIGKPGAYKKYQLFQNKFGEEIIDGRCPEPKTLHNDIRFSKGYSAIMYAGDWFTTFNEKGIGEGQEIVLNRKPLSSYYGKPCGKIPVVRAVLVLMITETTELGKYYDWNQYKPNHPYDYPLVFLAVAPWDKNQGHAEILGMITADGKSIPLKR